MKYIKPLFPMVIFYLVQFIPILILSIMLILLNPEIEIKDINNIIDNHTILINILIILINIIYVSILFMNYKKNTIDTELKISYINFIILGITISLLYNITIIILNQNNILDFNIYDSNILDMLILFITSCVIGPILEELIFRGYIYNGYKKIMTINKSLLLTTMLFSIVHFDIVKIIYAFILGYILNIIYEKYNNILIPIIIHIFANTIVIILSIYISIFNINYILLYIIITLSIIGIIYNIKKVILYD